MVSFNDYVIIQLYIDSQNQKISIKNNNSVYSSDTQSAFDPADLLNGF